MKNFLLLFCSLLTATARAEEPLRFVADVRDEALAEEAILLVHCLATRAGVAWELGAEARGATWLKVREEKSQLVATYSKAGTEKTATFRLGESEAACDALEPALALTPSLAPSPVAAMPTPLAALPPEEVVAASESGSKTWLWIAGGAAVLGAGFLLLHSRSKRPAFSAIEMN